MTATPIRSRWLKLHPISQEFDVAAPEVASLVRKAGELDLTVLFDAASPTDIAQTGKFVQLALDVPDARLILAHAHGMDFPKLIMYEILANYEWWPRKVWVDISGTGSLLAGSRLLSSSPGCCGNGNRPGAVRQRLPRL